MWWCKCTLRRSKRACTKTWQKHPWWNHPWCTQLLKRHELSSNWTANCRACRVSAKSLGSAMWKSAVAGKRSASCRCASMVARHGDDVTSVRVTRRHASAMSALVGTCSAWIEIKSWQSQLRNTESHMMSSQMIPRSSFFHHMTPWSLLSRSVVLQLFDGAAVGAASFALPQMHRRCSTLLDPVGLDPAALPEVWWYQLSQSDRPPFWPIGQPPHARPTYPTSGDRSDTCCNGENMWKHVAKGWNWAQFRALNVSMQAFPIFPMFILMISWLPLLVFMLHYAAVLSKPFVNVAHERLSQKDPGQSFWNWTVGLLEGAGGFSHGMPSKLFSDQSY